MLGAWWSARLRTAARGVVSFLYQRGLQVYGHAPRKLRGCGGQQPRSGRAAAGGVVGELLFRRGFNGNSGCCQVA